jgi:tRNA A37 threonylcarbamoyladenosine modification protein TsaB
MAQIYWGCFQATRADAGGGSWIAVPAATDAEAPGEAVSDPIAVRLPAAWAGARICGAGSGFDAYPALRSRPDLPLAPIFGAMRPRALEIARLAAADGLAAAVAPEAAQPVYLRDEVTARPS